MRTAAQRVAVEGRAHTAGVVRLGHFCRRLPGQSGPHLCLGVRVTWVLITGLVPTSVASCVTAGELYNSSETLTCFADKDAPCQGCCDHENGLSEGCGPC